jgi:hypothetical protein
MYITPRVLIQQEFLQVPVYAEFPLPAFIIGPQFSLRRYSEPSEKALTMVGTLDGIALDAANNYSPTGASITLNSSQYTGVRYDFPHVATGGDVDQSYTKVYMESVEAQYFPLVALGDATNEDAGVETVVGESGNTIQNRLRFPEVLLKTGNGFERSTAFLSKRDVAVGDIIEVVDDLDMTFRARVTALVADTYRENSDLASTIGAEVELSTGDFFKADGVGHATVNRFTSASATFVKDEVVGKYLQITGLGVRKIIGFVDSHTLLVDTIVPVKSSGTYTFRIGGVYNDLGNVGFATEDYNNAVVHVGGTGSTAGGSPTNPSTAYKGNAATGVFSDVYTITVTSDNTSSKASVTFSVESQSGSFAPQTDLILDEVGGDYLLDVDSTGDNEVVLDFSDVTAFVRGTQWTLTVTAPTAQVEPTTSGTYTGPSDMVYKIVVERGGKFYNGNNADTCARLRVSASDIDTPSDVLPYSATSFNVGKFGVRASFATGSNNDGLIVGDVYYIPVTAAKLGAYHTVELSENLPPLMLTVASTGKTAKLLLTKPSVEIPQLRDLYSESNKYNWVQEDSYIGILAGIAINDQALVVEGNSVTLPVKSGKLFVEHRDLLQDNVVAIDSLRSLADVTTKLGVIHPDNPLAQGVYDAVLNSANQIVYFLGVQTNDLVGYTQAIKIAEKSDKVYSFVPLTFDRTIQDAVVGHVNAYSTKEVGRWRIAWLSVQDVKTRTMYSLKENGENYKATITDDPQVSNTQFKLVTIEGAKFVEDGVRPGDSIKLNFRLDPKGDIIADEYFVDHVRSNTTLTITKTLTAQIAVPVKVEVVRNYTKSERANNIAHIGGDYNNRRVRVVFPDTYKYGGVTKQGYFAAAGLAGLRSGVVPHQGLTNSEFLGVDDLSKVVIEFNQDDLNVMAEQGIWLITQEVIGATAYVRHQITTDERSLNTREDSITTNVDNISYTLKAALAPYIGRYNINPGTIHEVYKTVVGVLRDKATNTYTARAGNQLLSFTPKDDILRIESDPFYKDRIIVDVNLNVPYPLNYINLTLFVA